MIREKTLEAVNKIGAAQDRYLLSIFGSEEELLRHIDDFVLEEKTEFSPATLDPFSDNYTIKILTTFRLRPKSIEEKEYDAEQRRLSLLSGERIVFDGDPCLGDDDLAYDLEFGSDR